MKNRILSLILLITLAISTSAVYSASAEPADNEGYLLRSGYFTSTEKTPGGDIYGFDLYEDTGEKITAAKPGDVVVYHMNISGFQGLSENNYITIIAAYTNIDTRVFEPFFVYDEYTGEYIENELDTDQYATFPIIPQYRNPGTTNLTYTIPKGTENTAMITLFYKWNSSSTLNRRNTAIKDEGDLFTIFLKVKDTAPNTDNALKILTVEDDSRSSATATGNINDAATNYGQFGLTMQTDTPDFSVIAQGDAGVVYDTEVTQEDGVIASPEVLIKDDGSQFAGWKVIENSGGARIGDEMDCVPEAGSLIQSGVAYGSGTEAMRLQAVYINVQTQTGAGVRWAAEESERGMRFETFIDAQDADYITAHGTLIAPAENITSADIFSFDYIEEIKALDIIDDLYYGSWDKYNRYYGAVVDFEKYFRTEKIDDAASFKAAGRGYATVTYADGSTGTIYSPFNAADHVRSIDQIAAAALADTDANYSAGQIKILELLANGAEPDGSLYRKDEKDCQKII